MSDLNNISNNDKSVELSGQKQETLFNKFITDFSNSYFSWDEKNSRLDSIFKSKNLSSDLKKELELFLALKSDEFSSWITRLDLKKLNVFDFRKKLLSKYLELQNKRQNLKDKILSDYDIPKNQIVTIDTKIWSLSDFKIDNLLKKENLRSNFLNTIFTTLIKKQDIIKDFFLKFDILTWYTDFSQEKKDAIMKIFNNDGTLRKIDIRILDELFEAWIFNLEQKKEIVSYFIPSISLADIRRLKLYWANTDKSLNNFKESIIDSFLNENDINFDTENQDFKESILSLINEDNIKIPSLELLYSDNLSIDKLDELIETNDFNDFVNLYNKKLEEAYTHESNSEFKEWFESFKKQLLELNNVNWLDNFKEWNYIVLDLYLETDEKPDKDISKQFFKIKKLDNWEFWLSLIDSWFSSIDFMSNDSKDISYKNFITLLSKWLKINSERFIISKCNFLSKKSLDENINKWLIELTLDDKTKIELDDEYNLSKLKEEKEILESEKYKKVSELDEIKELDKKISEINLEISSTFISEEKKLELLSKLEEVLTKKEKMINELFESDDSNLSQDFLDIKDKLNEVEVNIFNLENIYSYDKLLKNLDEFDIEGKKYGLSEWLSFNSTKWIFTITKIDRNNNTIDVNWIWWISNEIQFKDFFQEFKKIKSKRLSSSLKFNDLVSNICTDTSLKSDMIDSWSGFEVKNNWIHKKWSTKNVEYDYLKSTESNELLKIENISWDKALVSFWEYDDYERNNKWEIKKDKKWDKIRKQSITMFSWSNRLVSISWLESWIKSQTANPSSIDENKDVEKTDIKWEKIKWSFLSRYLNRLSIHDIISWFKIGIDSIESYLKEWTDEKAARAAQWMFGKILPEALRDDLMTRVEDSQKKRSEEYISKLWNVDSWKATSMIIDWLKNKDAPQYLKEAGALFMLQKYGVLYAKDLYAYKWKFLFYESFWWKIWDELFEKVKSNAAKTHQNFTEEQLVYELLKEQCREKWFNWIRRRSRLHKEFKKHRNVWKEDEFQTWQNDAKDERTIWSRVWWAMWELKWGTYANARWWLEEAINKWWSMEEMNKVPFVMAFSWISYNFEQNELDKLKNFPANSRMVPILRFLSYSNDIDLINETILEVCKRYSEIKWEKEVYKDALKIFSNQKSNSISERDKIEKTEIFYKNHWKVITDILYMLNTWEESKNSYLSKMILIEKDDRVDADGTSKSWNVIFKRYFDSLHAYTWEFVFWNDDLYWDAFSWKWTSWINIHKATKELLQQVQWWTYRLASAWPAMWDEISNEIDSVIKRDYGIYWQFWKEKDLKNIIRWFIWWLLEAHGTNSMALRSLVSSNSSTVYSKSKEWWIDLTKIMRYSYSDVLDLKAEWLVNEYVDILLNWKQQSWSSKFDETIFGVKDAINNI